MIGGVQWLEPEKALKINLPPRPITPQALCPFKFDLVDRQPDLTKIYDLMPNKPRLGDEPVQPMLNRSLTLSPLSDLDGPINLTKNDHMLKRITFNNEPLPIDIP